MKLLLEASLKVNLSGAVCSRNSLPSAIFNRLLKSWCQQKISRVEIEVFLLLTLAAPVIYMYRNSGVAKLIVKFMQIADIKF